MKMTLKEMCTLQRALGIIEGVGEGITGARLGMLGTAVEMIDELLNVVEVETR